MSNPLRFRAVDTDVLLRAIAISLVVWNHAIPSGSSSVGVPDLAGGMTLLMMMSGYSFARFALVDAEPAEVRRGLISFGLRILVPSIVAVILFMAIKRRFSLTELLFISNWFTTYRIVIFPVWYVQVMVQMMLLLLAVFAIPPVARWFTGDPLQGSVTIFLTALVMRIILPLYIDTRPLMHHLPHLYLWNFALGWVVYFLQARHKVPGKALASLAIIAAGALVWTPASYQFVVLSLGGLALVWVRRASLPGLLVRAASILSQATFTIFLLHRFIFATYLAVLARFLPVGMFMWAVGLMASAGAWILASATLRAYKLAASAGPLKDPGRDATAQGSGGEMKRPVSI
ncbi:hypothetical protein BV96_03970 [Sphingomonas paucimobilis]|nr:hypothetical protein BV96_03970 [Sphingomonas paucimobilis]